jgi:hypothetical protein
VLIHKAAIIMKPFNRRLKLKKETISQLQPSEMKNIKGGDEEFLSIISCNTNRRTCGGNCCPVLSTLLADASCIVVCPEP